MRIIYFLLTLSWLSLGQAADIAKGKLLVEQNCVGCHGTDPYTKQNRAVQSLEQLQERVKMCAHAQDFHWSDTDIENATAYLNSAFYHVN